MNSIKGTFSDYQQFREQLEQGPPRPQAWSSAAMSQLRSQLLGTDVDIVALATDTSIKGCELIPGNSLSMQWVEPNKTLRSHSHAWWHLFIIQAGQGELRLAQQPPLPIGPGDVCFIPAWADHGFLNTSSTEVLAMLNLSNIPQVHALGSAPRLCT